MQERCYTHRLIHAMNHMNGLKDRNNTIISIDAEKVLDHMQHSFMIPRVEIAGTFLNIIKASDGKSTADTT